MLSRIFFGLILGCVLQVDCFSKKSVASMERSRIRHRRTLNYFYYPYNSCYALAVVLSLPLEDSPAGRSVFCSFNFESNFYFPTFDNANGLVPLPFSWIDEPGTNAGSKHRITLPPAYRQFSDSYIEAEQIENENNTQSVNSFAKSQTETNPSHKSKSRVSSNKPKTKAKKPKAKSRRVRTLLSNYLISRRRFYKMMESNMDRSGLDGNDCMLKAICEVSHEALGLNNGVIGSVIDVLFLPSASKDEKLPKRYYQAERNGKSGSCDLYNKECPKGIFDFISKII